MLIRKAAVAALTLVLVAGCGGLFPAAVRIVMQIGARVVIAEGVDFVRQILAGDKPGSSPTVTIKRTDGSQPTEVYEVSAADSIKVSVVNGDLHVAGDGRNATVTLSPGTTATLEIVAAEVDKPAPPDPARIRIVEPKTLDGRPRADSAQFGAVVDELRAGLAREIPEASRTVGQIYGVVGKDTLVLVSAAQVRLTDPPAELRDMFAGMAKGGVRVNDIQKVDPGPLGGTASCGAGSASGQAMTVCGWADGGSIGMLIFYDTPAKAIPQFTAARADVEKLA